ncbi:MAG: hypothetical protein R3324_10330 [Halobacteriales archaeon]|nr:hypothetical protein [Halobacteriales archaeon]
MTWFTSAGDDPNPTPPSSGRGEGTRLKMSFAGPGTQEVDLTFIEPVELHDGAVFYTPVASWTMDDTFDLSAVMPATPVTPNNNGNGNVDLVNLGGYNMIVPNNDGTGTHDLGVADAVPVPTGVPSNGYWDVDWDTGDVTPAPAGQQGQADWLLLDVEVQSYFMKRMPFGNPLGQFEIDTYKAEWISPKWTIRWSVTKVSTDPAEAAGWLMLFRRYST